MEQFMEARRIVTSILAESVLLYGDKEWFWETAHNPILEFKSPPKTEDEMRDALMDNSNEELKQMLEILEDARNER